MTSGLVKTKRGGGGRLGKGANDNISNALKGRIVGKKDTRGKGQKCYHKTKTKKQKKNEMFCACLNPE